MSQRFWSPFVADLEPYVPGEQPKLDKLTKLNTNENPYGPSPRVVEAIRAAAGDGLRLYPPPGAEQLRQAIADYYQLGAAQVFVGNGSDEVLAHLFNALFRHSRPLLFPDITYSFYPVYCQLFGIDYRQVPLDQSLAIDVGAYRQDNGGIIFPNPNAPTGRLLDPGEIRRLLEFNQDSVVCIDEAYIDFGGHSASVLVNEFDNLVVIQTLSKSRSLAGLRLGFALANAGLIEALERVKNSFNSYPVGQLAIAGGIAAFADDDYFQRCRQAVIDSRSHLSTELQALGFEVMPSGANFVFAAHPSFANAAVLAEALRAQGIIVRHFDKPRICQYLRITVGDEEQITRLLENLTTVLTRV